MMTHKKHIKDSKLSTGRTRDKRRDNLRDNITLLQTKTFVAFHITAKYGVEIPI